MTRKRKFWRNRRGQGLTEYALLICLLSLGLILVLGRYRNALGNSYRNSGDAMRNVVISQAPATTGGTGNNGNGNGNNGNGNNGNGNGNGNGNNGNGNGNGNNGFIFNTSNGFIFNTSNGSIFTTNNGSAIILGAF